MVKSTIIFYFLILLPEFFYSQNPKKAISNLGYAVSFYDADKSKISNKGIKISIFGSNDLESIQLKANKLGIFIIPKSFKNDSIKFSIKYKSVKINTKFYAFSLVKNGGEIQIGNVSNYRDQRSKYENNDKKKLDLLNNKNLYYYIITNEFIRNSFESKRNFDKLKYFVMRPNMSGTGGIFYDYVVY